MPTPPRLVALARASHPGPTLAVTALTGLLAAAGGHDLRSGAVVTAAVGTGQLSIGWSNDLIDAARDREVDRPDKPVARGEVSPRRVRAAVAVALVASVVLSLASGPASAGAQLFLVVGSGWAYNLGLKGSVWSGAPYAVAFGALPAVVTLAHRPPQLPPVWMLLAGALIGMGAHLLNALPDLADDARTGVRGWPHRLGARRVRLVAPLLLVGAAAVTVFGPRTSVSLWAWAAFAACLPLGAVAMRGRGRLPFTAAIVIAGIAVASLLLRR